MASIKYRLHSKKLNAPIYLRLSINRKNTFERKTGLNIDFKNWSSETSLPKQNNPNNKNLATKLRDLESFIHKKLNEAASNGVEVDADWLQLKIDIHFQRVNDNNQSENLIDAIQNLIDTASIRKNGTGGLGLSKSRIGSYKQLKKKIIEFDSNRKSKVKNVDKRYAQNFLSYLINDRKYSESYSLKRVSDLKTVCYDAEANGIEVSAQLKRITVRQAQSEDVLYLSPEELTKIEKADIINKPLANARKWLLLGCNIGQRGNDLLNINEDNFVTRNGLHVIELTQQKTGKPVTIPILQKTKEILETGLPYKISLQKFNDYVKKVCKAAEINQIVKGGKRDKKLNRKVSGLYPKYKLIGSHVCRRSFATNNYGILPTPLIMQITRHATEKMLLKYIGKNGYDYAQQISDFYKIQELKSKKEPQLEVLKKYSNQL